MAKQKNVQTQNSEDRNRIKECAQNFRDRRNMPQALIDCFEAMGIDLNLDVLTWHDRMPFGGPTDAYRGTWLTWRQQFFEYEIYLDVKDEYVTEIDTWNNVTAEVELIERKRGTGKTIGWLEIEVLVELNS